MDSLIDGCARFAIHRTKEGGFGYKISSPAGIFLWSLLLCLWHCDILGRLLNFQKDAWFWLTVWVQCSPRNPLLYECKQMCSNLLWNGVEVEKMLIPSHVGLEGNELVDKREYHVSFNSTVFDRCWSISRLWQDLFC
jgi:hypothetical protein